MSADDHHAYMNVREELVSLEEFVLGVVRHIGVECETTRDEGLREKVSKMVFDLRHGESKAMADLAAELAKFAEQRQELKEAVKGQLVEMKAHLESQMAKKNEQNKQLMAQNEELKANVASLFQQVEASKINSDKAAQESNEKIKQQCVK